MYSDERLRQALCFMIRVSTPYEANLWLEIKKVLVSEPSNPEGQKSHIISTGTSP